MLTLNDGRSELWQWDTGRTLAVDADCSQVHFSNKVFGRSIDVYVIDGIAIVPDILLQTDKDLNVWAFVGTAENGYTKISKTFKVNRRNKPADYVFTPPDQTSLEEIKEKIEYLESIQDPDAIKNAVEDYLEQNPVESPVQSVNGYTGKVELTAEDVGAISQDDLQEATNEALAQAKASGEFKGDPGADGKDGKDGQNGSDYVLTDADKQEIAEQAAELVEIEVSGGSVDLHIGPDKPANGALYWLDTSDSGGVAKEYSITTELTKVTVDNDAESVTEGKSYAVAVIADDGYELSNVRVTMGGVDITNTAYANGNIYIPSVTGDVVIIAVATEIVEGVTKYTITNNLVNVTTNNSAVSVEENSEYTATLTAATDYRIETVTVTMGGVDVTDDVYADGVITIPAVTGDVVITVTTISAPVSAVFELETPMTFDGAEEYQIDYCLTDKDKDWSVIIDFTADAKDAEYVFRSGNTNNNSLGIRSQGSYFWYAQVQYYDNWQIATGAVVNNKVVFTHMNGSNELNVYCVNKSGEKKTYTFTRENYVSDLCGASSVTALGQHPCTIDEFKCYARVISDSEITSFLGVE